MKRRFLKNKIQKLLFGIYNNRNSNDISSLGTSHTIIPTSFEKSFPSHDCGKVSSKVTYIP